jgi:hypothetical protein
MPAFRRDYGSLRPPRFTADGAVCVDAILTRTGVFVYRDSMGRETREYRPPEEVFNEDSMRSFEGVPVTDDHPESFVTKTNVAQLKKGRVSGDVRRDGNDMRASLVIDADDLIAKMRAGKRDVSNGYSCDLDPTPGVTPEGERYDVIQRNIRGNHAAIVDRGRAGNARARFDGESVQVVAGGWNAASVYVSSRSMSLDAMKSRLAELLADQDVEVTQVKRDAGDKPGAPLEICGNASHASLQIVSSALSADALYTLVKKALQAAPDINVHMDSDAMLASDKAEAASAVTNQRRDAMDLTQALAALAEANTKIGTLTEQKAAESKRADVAEQARKDSDAKIVKTEAERDDAKDKLVKADEAVKTADAKAEQLKKDAANSDSSAVKARIDVIVKAAACGVTSIKLDGKDVATVDAETKAVKLAVIEKVMNKKLDRTDDAYVDARFDIACEQDTKSAKAFSGLTALVNPTNGTAPAPKAGAAAPHADQDDEETARRQMMKDSRNAHKDAKAALTTEGK